MPYPFPRPRHRRTPSALALRGWSAVLLLAMLLAQGLGLWHRVAETDPAHRGQPHLAANPSFATDPLAASDLFHHHDEAQCRLFDQISRGDCAPSAPVTVLAPAPSPAASTWLPAAATPRQVLVARARGPPPAA